MGCSTVDLFLVCWDTCDGMVEWVIVANKGLLTTKHDKQEATLT